MDNSNIIISVIIVLCIAAGVTAYGITEGDNAVFNDLTGFSPDSTSSGDNGIGDLFGDNSVEQTLMEAVTLAQDQGLAQDQVPVQDLEAILETPVDKAKLK